MNRVKDISIVIYTLGMYQLPSIVSCLGLLCQREYRFFFGRVIADHPDRNVLLLVGFCYQCGTTTNQFASFQGVSNGFHLKYILSNECGHS